MKRWLGILVVTLLVVMAAVCAQNWELLPQVWAQSTSITIGGGGLVINNGVLSGNGAGFTNLNASALASGTVPDGRLSSNVPLLNASVNAFTGTANAQQLGTTTNIQINNPITTVNCSTSGTIAFSTPFGGPTNFKGNMAVLQSCVGTANYTIPSAYTFIGSPFYAADVSSSNVVVSESGTTLTVTATVAATGSVLILGY